MIDCQNGAIGIKGFYSAHGGNLRCSICIVSIILIHVVEIKDLMDIALLVSNENFQMMNEANGFIKIQKKFEFKMPLMNILIDLFTMEYYGLRTVIVRIEGV
jgi:hypothetical protein